MRIRVRYTAHLKQATGATTESVELDGPCLAMAFGESLDERHGDPLRQFLLDADGRLRSGILVFVGDDQAVADRPVALRDGDLVTLMTPIAGG